VAGGAGGDRGGRVRHPPGDGGGGGREEDRGGRVEVGA
jgi:hypothetical protein